MTRYKSEATRAVKTYALCHQIHRLAHSFVFQLQLWSASFDAYLLSKGKGDGLKHRLNWLRCPLYINKVGAQGEMQVKTAVGETNKFLY